MISDITENEVNVYKSCLKTARFYGRKPFATCNNNDCNFYQHCHNDNDIFINSNTIIQKKFNCNYQSILFNNNNYYYHHCRNDNEVDGGGDDEHNYYNNIFFENGELDNRNSRRFQSNNGQISILDFKQRNERGFRSSYDSSTLGTKYF